MASDRPAEGVHFEHPPLVELALSVQFSPLTKLRVTHLGLLWQRFKARFDRVEEQPPLERFVEDFGEPKPVTFEISLAPLPLFPRVWFLNAEGNELIQVQRDLFAHNWRKSKSGDVYPSYRAVRDTFAEEFGAFLRFVEEQGLGGVEPDHVAVTYVDHVSTENFGRLGVLLNTWSRDYADPRMGEPEEASCALRFMMKDASGKPFGRIYMDLKPGYRREDKQRLFIMQTVGRGRPSRKGVEGVLETMDSIHRLVVDCFLSITRPEMHAAWGKKS
jgi:uncharacterized protein (TIGR04255 family)